MASNKKAVVFNGSADIRRLGAVDFAKSGVDYDGPDIDFRQGHPFQVSADIHKALLGDPDLYGNFSDADAKDVEPEEEPPATEAASTEAKSVPGASSTVTKQ